MKNLNPLEKDIEKKVCEYAKSQGCLVYKFTSPNRMSVPDRLFFCPDGRAFLIEFKRLGCKPTPAQAVEIEKLRGSCVKVFVIDNVEEGKKAVFSMVVASPF